MCPDLAIYWTLGNFSKPVATISLPKSHTFLGNFYKGAKIFNFSGEIILGNFFRHLATFYWSHWWDPTPSNDDDDDRFDDDFYRSLCQSQSAPNIAAIIWAQRARALTRCPGSNPLPIDGIFILNFFYTRGQSYKSSTSTNNDSRVALSSKLLIFTNLDM